MTYSWPVTFDSFFSQLNLEFTPFENFFEFLHDPFSGNHAERVKTYEL